MSGTAVQGLLSGVRRSPTFSATPPCRFIIKGDDLLRKLAVADYRYVKLNIPEACLLADLFSQAEDLQATADLCDLALAEFSKGSSVVGLHEALTSAAVIRYARIFNKGVRANIPNTLLDGLPENQKTDHEFFIALRNKYIAHSVNAFEETRIVVYLVPEEIGPRGVASIGVQHDRLVSLGDQDFSRLKALSLVLHRLVSISIREEERKVLDSARKLPADGRYSQIDSPKKVAVDSDVNKPRKRH